MKTYMKLAVDEAIKGMKKGEVPVGAVVVKDGNIIGMAHNEVESRENSLCHAELLAIQRASEYLGNWRLTDCSLFVTLEPCIMCMGAVLNSRIKTLVYGATDTRTGAVESQSDFIRSPLFKDLIVYSGILEGECTDLLQNFFKTKRNDLSN